MSELLHDTARRAARYLETLETRAVAPSAAAVEALAGLGGPLPERGLDAAQVIARLDSVASPATMASAGGRYFGFVTGGTLPAALAASWLANAWDQNAFSGVTSPAAAALEEIALDWLLNLLGLPSGSAGSFTTGATMANFAALAAARHAVLAAVGWDVDADGLCGAPPITVVVGAEVHSTVPKALGLLGLGRQRVVSVPADAQGRLRADALPALRGPTIVCLQAGNVNTGAFDPFAEVCAAAREAGAWVHVDGAFGLWAATSPQRRHLVDGVAQADSWATDAHKWLNVPYDSGLAFVRDAAALRAATAISAPYLLLGHMRPPSDFTPESSRRARGVEIWAALTSLGRAGVAALIDRTCGYAERFAAELRASGAEILNQVVLNQVLVSFGDDARTQRVIAAVQADGTCWCGGTVWHGRTAMRISVSCWATGDDDVTRSIAAIRAAAAAAG